MSFVRRLLFTALLSLAASGPARADYAEAGVAFRALSFEDRILVQFCLMFTDDYVALADGLFGSRTFEAITSFQRRNDLTPTGVLSPVQFQLLVSQAAQLYGATGFTFLDDPRTGIQIGVPTALLPATTPTERGSRWASHDGSMELETISMSLAEISYEDLYERLAIEKATRRITYKTLNAGFFVVSGINRGKLFYSRYQRGPLATRGFSLAWEPRHDLVFRRLSIAISNSLLVNPARLTAPPPPPPVASAPPLVEAPAAPVMLPSQSAEPPEVGSGSGFFVTPGGHIATNAHVVEGCTGMDVAGHGSATLVRADPTNDLAVIKVAGAPGISVQLRLDPVRIGEDVVAMGFPLSEIMADSLTVTAGNVSSLSGPRGDSRELQISAPVQPGNSGGPLFDRYGGVVGMVSSRLDERAALKASGSLPQNVNFAIKASLLADFLQSAGVDPVPTFGEGTEQSIANIAEIGKPATVQIICRRQ